MDGKSNDSTIEILKYYSNKYNFIEYYSESDSSMYEALSKGFAKASGDIIAYLNAGDFYSKTALETVYDIFSEYSEVNWITGIAVRYNYKSQVIGCLVPYKYRRKFILNGVYNGKKLPFIQQESTFWRKDLNENIEYNTLSKFKLAGDYYLWTKFSEKNTLYVINSYLGGFKVEKGQLSNDLKKYYQEMKLITDDKICFFWFDLFIWLLPAKIKKKLSKTFFYYNYKLNKWVKG